MATHELTLNLKKTNIAPPVITVHQGDSAEVLKAAIYDGDKKAALTGCKVHLMAAKPDHTYVEQQFTGISDNVATVTVDPAVFGVAGLLKVCYVRVRNAAGLDATTENVLVNVLPSASASGEISGPYVDAVEAIVADLKSQLADVSRAQHADAEGRGGARERGKAARHKRRRAQTDEGKRARGREEASRRRKRARSRGVSAEEGVASIHRSRQRRGIQRQRRRQHALQIANSVAQGSAGSSDMAKQKQQIADLYGKMADATDAFIYDDGTVYCPASKASASGSTVTFGSTCTASGTTLNLK